MEYLGLYIMLGGVMLFIGIFAYLGTRPEKNSKKHK